MSSLRTVIAVILLAGAFVMAQDRPAYSPNTIAVGADGKFEAAPDTALITFGISAQDSTSRGAYDKAAKASEQVRNLLKTNGIDPKMAEIGYFSLQPVFDYKDPKRKIVAYRGNSQVNLKLKDFTKVGPILQGIADLDVTDNQQISYILDDMDDAKVKAAQDALQRAKAEATAVATTGGRSLAELVYVSVDTFEPPRPMPMMRSMAKAGAAENYQEPTADFSAQKITVNAHVNAIFGLK